MPASSLFPPPGPTLPPFGTLLVKGPYHPSAPVHLCLSHTSQNPATRAALLTPSRQTFVHALGQYHDDRSSEDDRNAGSDVTSKIDLFYPPSPAHLAFLLAMFRKSQPSDGPSSHTKTTFDVAPALLVLLEPSSYFLTEDPEQSCTISSYLTLISHALATVSFLSNDESGTHRPAFALFDSHLDQLKLPILGPTLRSRTDGDDASRKEYVSFFARKYFDWVATFEEKGSIEEQASSSSGGHKKKQMRLCSTTGKDEATEWEWIEGDIHNIT